MHLPVARADPGQHLRQFLGDVTKRTEAIVQGHPLDTERPRRAGEQRPAREDPVLHRHREAGRRRVVTGGSRAELSGDLAGRLLHAAHDLRGSQQDADLPGGDLRSLRVGDRFQRLRRRHQDRQRHSLRPRRGRVGSQWQHRLQGGPRDPSRPRVGEQLPLLPGARGVRRLQAVRHRPREPPDDARPLPADQEPAGELLGTTRSDSSNVRTRLRTPRRRQRCSVASGPPTAR